LFFNGIQSLSWNSQGKNGPPQAAKIKREAAAHPNQLRIRIAALALCFGATARRDKSLFKKRSKVEADFIKRTCDSADLAALEVPLGAQAPIDIAVPEALEAVLVTIHVCRNQVFYPLAARSCSAKLLHIQIGCLVWLATQRGNI